MHIIVARVAHLSVSKWRMEGVLSLCRCKDFLLSSPLEPSFLSFLPPPSFDLRGHQSRVLHRMQHTSRSPGSNPFPPRKKTRRRKWWCRSRHFPLLLLLVVDSVWAMQSL